MRYKVDIKDENNKTLQSYDMGFSTDDDLSHNLLDMIIEHLEIGWYVVITLIGLFVAFLYFGG